MAHQQVERMAEMISGGIGLVREGRVADSLAMSILMYRAMERLMIAGETQRVTIDETIAVSPRAGEVEAPIIKIQAGDGQTEDVPL